MTGSGYDLDTHLPDVFPEKFQPGIPASAAIGTRTAASSTRVLCAFTERR